MSDALDIDAQREEASMPRSKNPQARHAVELDLYPAVWTASNDAATCAACVNAPDAEWQSLLLERGPRRGGQKQERHDRGGDL